MEACRCIPINREFSCSVVETEGQLTRDGGVSGWSLTGVTALYPWARRISPCLVVQPRKTRHNWKIVDWDVKDQIKLTNKQKHTYQPCRKHLMRFNCTWYFITADIYQSGSEAEERLLPPQYHQLPPQQQRNIIRPKPLKIPVDAQTHQRERKYKKRSYLCSVQSLYYPNNATKNPHYSDKTSSNQNFIYQRECKTKKSLFR